MTDAAFVIAPMAPSPRPQPTAASNAANEVANGESDFGAELHASMDKQDTAPPKPSPMKKAENSSSPDGESATATDRANKTEKAKTPKQAKESKAASPAKPEKTNEKGSAADSDVGAAQSVGAQPVTAPTSAINSITPGDALAAALSAPSDGPCASPTDATTQFDPAKAVETEIAAALAPSPANGAPEANAQIKTATDAAPSDAAGSQALPAAPVALAAVPQESQPAVASAKSDHDDAARRERNSIATFNTAVAEVVSATQNAAPEAAAAAEATVSATPAPAATDVVLPNTAPAGPAKKDMVKNTAAATSANALLGILAATGAPDLQTAGAAKPDTSTLSGKAAPDAGAIAAAAPDAAKLTQAGKAVPTVPNLSPKANAPDVSTKEVSAVSAKDIPATQQPPAPIAHTADANSALPAHAAPNALAAQPAVPQAQNPAVFAANIVDTTPANANAPATIHAQMDGPRLTLPADQIALEVRRHTLAGADHFNIKIDPPELGRIDVKIEMTSDGQTKAHLAADRQDTLDLLQRDSKLLERALNSNGLKTDRDSLNFSLRQDNPSNQGRNGGGAGGNGAGPTGYWSNLDDEVAEAIAPVRASIIDPTRVDLLI